MRAFAAALAVVGVLAAMAPNAGAHDDKGRKAAQQEATVGTPAPPDPSSVQLQTVLDPFGALRMANGASGAVPPASGAAVSAPLTGTVTRLPLDPTATYETPADPCDPASCTEIQVTVPDTGARSLYARIAWQQPSYYLHLWAIAPDASVVGAQDVNNSFVKEVGNERTIPVAELAVTDPVPGVWRIQARAVFGYQVGFDGAVVVGPDPALTYQRLDTRSLADLYGTQQQRVNVVFLGREPSKDQVKALRDQMPAEYRLGVLSKASGDCDPNGGDTVVDCQAGTLLDWRKVHFSGTRATADDANGDAGGRVPYFEPIKFTYDYRFFEADQTYTADLFAYISSITSKDAPFDVSDTSTYLAGYNATGGLFRAPDSIVTKPDVSDKIDARAVEDWIFSHRGDARYQQSFRDLETGASRDGAFINPDPSAYWDPFYTAFGTKDVDRMPQGPSTSLTVFVIDSFTSPLARQHFRPNAYHSYDISGYMVNPDTGVEDGPDYMRLWGGNYRFFYLDLGAMPNDYENVDGFTGKVGDSTTYPDGDPPIWEALRNPLWSGETTLYDKTARNIRSAMFYRLTAPYLYRPLPADVYFLAANIWSDYYSRPEGGGLSYSVLDRLYRPSFVRTNLASALPAATFTTEEDIASLQTYRYLGCSNERAGTNSQVAGTGQILIPDPTCTDSDPIQHALEEAKAIGDDIVGAGIPIGASAGSMRAYIEQHRDQFAPLRPGQLTVTNISVVFPLAESWALPIAAGIAFPTPNDEIWGILQNVNDRFKTYKATDCTRSLPFAPGCGIVPPVRDPGEGLSYTIEHEATHFFGLLHPHDSLIVDKAPDGSWTYYADQYSSLFDFSQAPTTYAGSFFPYSVLDQDIIQRGHFAEYLRKAQDVIGDAYQLDGMSGLTSPSDATQHKEAEMSRWRDTAAGLFACGDYLHAEYAARNAYVAAQGIDGPLVDPKPLQPGEQVLFTITAQPVFGPDGRIEGCSNAAALAAPAAPVLARSPAGGAVMGIGTAPITGPNAQAAVRGIGVLPATGGETSPLLPTLAVAVVLTCLAVLRRARRT